MSVREGRDILEQCITNARLHGVTIRVSYLAKDPKHAYVLVQAPHALTWLYEIPDLQAFHREYLRERGDTIGSVYVHVLKLLRERHKLVSFAE